MLFPECEKPASCKKARRSAWELILYLMIKNQGQTWLKSVREVQRQNAVKISTISKHEHRAILSVLRTSTCTKLS